MSAPDFRDWLNDGEKKLQEEIEGGEDDDSDVLDEGEDDDEAWDDDERADEYAKVTRDLISLYTVACEVASPLDVPEYHEWKRARETSWLPMEAGVVRAAGQVSALFGCGCTWKAKRSGHGLVEFNGYDDNPAYARQAMLTLVSEAVTAAIKERPGGLADADSLFQLRLCDFVSGFCAEVSGQLARFLELREQAWEENGGKMHLLVYGSGQVEQPDVESALTDDEDYCNGVALATDEL